MSGERRLHINRGYGIYGAKTIERARAEQDSIALISKIFARHGFSIAREGDVPIDDNNPLEVGLGIFRALGAVVNKRDRYVGTQLGIEMPYEYIDRERILDSTEPLIAKKIDAHRGEEVYLLKTPEDKIRFVALAFASQSELKRIDQIQDIAAKRQEYISLRESARNRDFNPTRFEEDMSQFVVERQVETPTDRYTSFRVLAGADGITKYALLLYSKNKKTDTAPVATIPSGGYSGYDRFFLDPNSPLYINTPKVISNFAQNGGKINLTTLFKHKDRIALLSQEEKDILKAHGFNVDDPDKFEIPKELTEKAERVGKFMHLAYPYVGVDFLLGIDRKFYFLEANINPSVTPDNLDLPVGSTSKDAREMLFEEVAANLEQTH